VPPDEKVIRAEITIVREVSVAAVTRRPTQVRPSAPLTPALFAGLPLNQPALAAMVGPVEGVKLGSSWVVLPPPGTPPTNTNESMAGLSPLNEEVWVGDQAPARDCRVLRSEWRNAAASLLLMLAAKTLTMFTPDRGEPPCENSAYRSITE